MKKLINLLFLMQIAFSITAQTLTEQANNAYSEGDYTKAEQLYKELIEQSTGESPEVYYNLGNTYYRLNKTVSAILYYERALLFDPGNKDILFNLEIAKLKTVDRIESVDEFFLTKWINSLRDNYSTAQWSTTALISFLLLVACLFLFFFSRKIFLKKIGFFAGLTLVVVCIFSNIFAYQQKKKMLEGNTAIIFSPTTIIKSSPDASGNDLFILHGGTKIEIKSKLGDWSEIETSDGNVGWIRSNEIEII